MQLLLWMLDGVVASWLTGKLMVREGRDLMMDTVMGAAGGIAGGFLFTAAHILVRGAMIYTNLCALMGAVVLTLLSQQFGGRRQFSSNN
jgi:uncharacterized membrane protein YeaQ/YmgE (transglycosylase-associated protein family)